LKRILNSLLGLSLFGSGFAFAQTATPVPVNGTVGQSVLVNAPPPSTQYIFGNSGYALYFPGSSSTDPNNLANGEFYDSNYRLIDTTPSSSGIYGNGLIYLDISINQLPAVTGSQEVAITLGTTNTPGDEIPLTGASVVDQSVFNQAPQLCGTNCIQGTRNSQLAYLSAIYSGGSVMRVSFKLSDLCATPGVANGTDSICPEDASNFAAGTGTTLSQQIVVTFSAADPTNVTTPYGSLSSSTAETLTINLTDVPPTIALPTSTNIEDFYAPGDGSVIFDADNYGATTGTTGSGAPVQSLVVLADRNSLPVINSNGLPGCEVSGTIAASGSNLSVGGFVNSSCNLSASPPTCTNGYNGSIYAENAAGIYSVGNPANTSLFPKGQGDVSSDGLLHAEPVNSVLSKSKCFIATAAFHDGDAAPVVMLRKFRDKILAKSSIGRGFIATYYTYSPPLAQWAWDKPIIRSIALHALAPVEFMAWAILKLTHAEGVSSQPYIDRVKKKLDETEPNPTPSTESYSDSLKKTLPPEPATTESYSEQEKKKLNLKRDDSAKDYSKKLKEDLPPDNTESTIAKVKEGRDKRPVPPKPPITAAFSAKFGLSPGVKVNNSEGVVNFQDMYGGGSAWQPDLVLHYERQLFHSENLGSFGIQGDLGVSYAEGYGQYEYGFGSTNTKLSKTKFSFLQFPVTFGAIYRFNLFRLLRPYVGVGVGTMIYDEIRTDGVADKNGQTPIYEGELGLAFNLDSFDKTTAKDGFMSEGIQHSYIFVEYMNMSSFANSGVTFGRNGIYLGFLVEY
jgi:hypothetical protein